MSEEIRNEEAKKLTDIIDKAEELDKLEEMIKNNVIYFSCDGIEYRVRKPNYAERQELREVKIKKHAELRNNSIWKYEVELIKELKTKGIDILDMQMEIARIQEKIEELQLKLAEFGDQKEADNGIIVELKMQIYNLLVEQRAIALKKIEYLSESIEAELLSLVNSYTCYLGLEKKEAENWVKVFKNYEEFMDSENENLLNLVAHYMSLIIYNK